MSLRSSPLITAFVFIFALLSDAAFNASAFAQFEVPQSQLSYIEKELDAVNKTLAEKVAAINYEDPGEDSGWKSSQAAWEKMDLKIGFPPPKIEQILAKETADRSAAEKKSLQSFYLSFVNQKTKPELQSLAERAEQLQLHKQGGQIGITDPILLEISKRFWKRRLVDPYRVKNKDKAKYRKLMIKFLSATADDFANDGRLGNGTDRLGRDRLKANHKHPVFLTMALYLNAPDTIKRTAKIGESLPELIKQLDSQRYPRILKMLARVKQCEAFRKKNFVNGREINAAKADELENACNDSILEMLVEESKCPENIEAFKDWYVTTILSNFRGVRHRQALYELISKSDLQEPFKQAMLQKVIGNLAATRKVERDVRKDYIQLAIDHGEKAAELLPLSDSVIEQLGMNTRSYEHPEVCMKWYEIGKHRAPGRYSFYKNYFDAVVVLEDLEKEVEFILGLLKSDDFEAGVPWIGIRLINDGIGLYRRQKDEKTIRDSRKVVLAYEALVNKAPEQGKSAAWCKEKKQSLCIIMLEASHFEDALRIAKDLEGDFGGRHYKGQKLTLARIAELTDPLARETQESIEAGTFDVEKIGETIDKLTEARMDMDPDESTYIDELMELLESIKAFESGEWANLTPETVHLSNWQGHDSSRWQPTENGLSMKTNNSSIVSLLGWRWKVDSEYVLEADIEITGLKKSSKERGAVAGFGISNGRFIMVPAAEILLNPKKSTAEMKSFREKRFSVKPKLNAEGSNRVRMRVWKDYFEFTINGTLAGQYAFPSAIPGHVILYKSYGAAVTTFKNVRVRKLTDPSPTWERINDASYWSTRLNSEPDSKDLQIALENAKATEKANQKQRRWQRSERYRRGSRIDTTTDKSR